MPQATYYGHSCFRVEGDAGSVIIDPFLRDNPLTDVTPDDIAVDFVILTHGHGDHYGDCIEISRKNKAPIIAVFELAAYCEAKGAATHSMSIGGSHNFPFGHLKYTIAHHSSSTPDGAYAGQPAGLLLTMDDRILYHAGDTALFLDMKLIGEMNKIDLAILPIGGNYTMGIGDAVKAADFLDATHYLPMHYNTFPLIEADPNEFVRNLAAMKMSGSFLNPGDSHSY